MLKKIWLIRIILFIILLIPLLMVKNKFMWTDEYCFAINLDQGTQTFHSYHLLSQMNAYIVWFFATIFGLKISAYRALQVASSIMASVGAVALIDLGVFWGLRLRYAVLFSLPIIFSNAFLRYGTSAYPDISAFGLGLVAINLLIRAVTLQDTLMEKNKKNNFLYISAIAAGFACFMHMFFITLIPGLILGIACRLRQFKQSLVKILFNCIKYILGLFSTLAIGHGLFFIFLKLIPKQSIEVKSYAIFTLTTFPPFSIPKLFNLLVNLKTFGAIFVPGFHDSNQILDLIYDLPRFFAGLFFIWLLINALKNGKKWPALSAWIIPMLVSVLTLFFVMLFFNYWNCRQYAAISLAVFGPLFLILGILTLNNKPFLAKLSFIIISGAFLFYMIFGIEGLIHIASCDNSTKLRELSEKCGIFKPKPIQFPWNPNKPSLYPECLLY